MCGSSNVVVAANAPARSVDFFDLAHDTVGQADRARQFALDRAISPHEVAVIVLQKASPRRTGEARTLIELKVARLV